MEGQQGETIQNTSKLGKKSFNCTAEVYIEADNVTGDVSPCKLRFRETDSIEKDGQDLCMFCQIHKCNDYCMRKTKLLKRRIMMKQIKKELLQKRNVM